MYLNLDLVNITDESILQGNCHDELDHFNPVFQSVRFIFLKEVRLLCVNNIRVVFINFLLYAS